MLQLESLLANQSLLAQYNLQSTIRSDYSLGSSMQKRVGSMKVTPKQYELIKDLADEYATRAYEEGKSGYEIDCRTPSLPLQESALAAERHGRIPPGVGLIDPYRPLAEFV